MQQTIRLRQFAARSATAFLLAVLCVYPLYIDKFSNLGVFKFTGVCTLSWVFCLGLGALALLGLVVVSIILVRVLADLNSTPAGNKA